MRRAGRVAWDDSEVGERNESMSADGQTSIRNEKKDRRGTTRRQPQRRVNEEKTDCATCA